MIVDGMVDDYMGVSFEMMGSPEVGRGIKEVSIAR